MTNRGAILLISSDVSIDSLTKSDTGIVGLSQGISILINGGIILAKGYDWAKNDDVYFRINSVTNLTEIAYSIDPDNSRFTFWQAYNIPINVFNQVNCYRYTPDLGEIKYYIGNTVTYISPETNEEDSAIVLATYTDKDNNIYYQLSRESKLFEEG